MLTHTLKTRRLWHLVPSYLAMLVAVPVSAYAAEHPNIVLLMDDDHRWEAAGYHGHAHVRTLVLAWRN